MSLHDALAEYLTTRRALGTQLKWPESSLRHFVDFIENEGAEFITTELAVRWALLSTGVQRATHARRLSIVRGFAVWLQPTDPRTQVPPQRLLPASCRRPSPHIYGDREIFGLIGAVDKLRSASGLRGATVKALLGLLVSTGLRPGEALALDVADVELVAGVLTVRESKFGKSRFVPLEESTRAALAAYAKVRDAATVDTDGISACQALTPSELRQILSRLRISMARSSTRRVSVQEQPFASPVEDTATRRPTAACENQ